MVVTVRVSFFVFAGSDKNDIVSICCNDIVSICCNGVFCFCVRVSSYFWKYFQIFLFLLQSV